MKFTSIISRALLLSGIFGMWVLTLPNPANSQHLSAGDVSFGIKGGVNANVFDNIQSDFRLVTEDVPQVFEETQRPSEGTAAGFNGGLFVRYQLSDVVGLQVEALYNEQGGVRKTPGVIGIKRARVTMHNAEIPLLLDFRILDSENIAGRLVSGGAVAYNMATGQNFTRIRMDPQHGFLTLTEGSFENVTSQYRTWQYGAYLGMRFDSSVGGTILHMDLRYRFGLGRVNELPRISDQFDARADTFSISVGIGL